MGEIRPPKTPPFTSPPCLIQAGVTVEEVDASLITQSPPAERVARPARPSPVRPPTPATIDAVARLRSAEPKGGSPLMSGGKLLLLPPPAPPDSPHLCGGNSSLSNSQGSSSSNSSISGKDDVRNIGGGGGGSLAKELRAISEDWFRSKALSARKAWFLNRRAVYEAELPGRWGGGAAR